MSDELQELISLACSEGCHIESGSIQSHTKAMLKRQTQEQVVRSSIAKDKADAERWRKLERLSASPRVENICFIDLTADEYEQFKAWAEGIGYKFAFERQGLQKVLEYLEQKIDSIKE